MMCPPSSLNESRIGVLPKFDSLWHTDSEVRVKWWVKLDLSHLLQEKDEFQRMQLYPTVGVGTVHLLHTLAWLSAHVWASAATMPNVPVPDSCSAPMLCCQSVALHTRQDALWAAPSPAHLALGTGSDLTCCLLLPHSRANRPTVPDTHLCRDAPEAPGQHTCAKVQCKPRCRVHSHAFMCMLHKFSPLSLVGKPLQAKAQSMEAAVISRLSFKRS